MHPLQFLNTLTTIIGKEYSHGAVNAISKECLVLESLTDEELTARCQAALAGAFELAKEPRQSLSTRMVSNLLGLAGLPSRHSGLNSLIALGVEAFRRAPADLPPDSALYPEQIRAATALTMRTAVEMETGEGKTYAILPAAFALACRHSRVYVVCASEHLAWRDANRTRNYWQLVGVTVGLGVKSTANGEWSHQVIYTTLDNLMFKELQEMIAELPPEHPVTYGAVLLDEVDAILLDQGAYSFSVTQEVERQAYDWSTAFDLCEDLVQGETILVDRGDLTASLTEAGETTIRRRLEQIGQSPHSLLVMRRLVELAFIANRVVKEDIDYVIEGSRAHAIDRLSGRVNRNRVPAWIPVLELKRKLQGHPHSVSLTSLSPLVFFRKFSHLSGTSGTALSDSLEYLLTHRLLTLRVKPRFPRSPDALEQDAIYRTKAESLQAATKRTTAMFEARRPVLIGTQTIADAERLYLLLREALPETARVTLLTGRDDSHAAQVFEAAGEVNSVVVATQLAGRGIDIRLSDEAMANGGLALVAVGHAMQSRHDRQFLGRAGRHGAPYSAVFIVSLEDELMRVLVDGDKIARVLQKLGMEEGEAISAKMTSRAIARAQRQVESNEFLLRRSTEFQSLSETAVYSSAAHWFTRLQDSARDIEYESDLSPAFLESIVSDFVHTHAGNMCKEKIIDLESSVRLVRALREELGLPEEAHCLQARSIEGCSGEVVHRVLKTRILRALNERLDLYMDVRSTLAQRLDLSHRQYHHVKKLSLLIAEADSLQAGEPEVRPEAPGSSRDDRTGSSLVHTSRPSDDEADDAKRWQALRQRWTEAASGAVYDLGQWVESHRAENKTVLESTERSIQKSLTVFANWIDRFQNATTGEATNDEPILETERAMVEDFWHLFLREKLHSSARIRSLLSRDLRSITSWSIKWTWLEFLQERLRLRFRYAQQSLSHYEYFRLTSSREEKAWRDAGNGIPARLLRNLFRAPYPHQLDALFSLDDYQTSSYTDTATHFTWESSEASNPPAPLVSPRLVDSFLALHEQRLSDSFNRSMLLRLLDDFLASHPLHSLRTEKSIQIALENWALLESERGVSTEKRKKRRRWLGKFLRYLRERRLIGPLPRLQDRLRSLGRRLTRNLSDLRTLAPLILTTSFLVLFGLIAWKGDVLPPLDLSPTAHYLGAWLTGGLVASGNPLGPAIGGLLLAAVLTALIWPTQTLRRIGTTLLERVAVMSTSLALATWMIWRALEGLVGARQWLLLVLWVILTLLITYVLLRITLLIVIETSIDLIGFWLSWCTLAVVTPLTIRDRPGSLVVWILGVTFLAAVAFAWRLFDRYEVELVSSQFLRAADPTSAEDVSTAARVPGSIGYAPYVIALCLVWVLAAQGAFRWMANLLPRPGSADMAQTWLPVGAYLLLVGILAATILSRRFRLRAWKYRLNRKSQAIRGIQREEELRAFLRKLRYTFIVREFLWATAMIGLLLLLLGAVPGSGAPVPLPLILFSSAMLISHELPDSARQFRNFLAGGGSLGMEVFEIERFPEPPPEVEDFWVRLRRATENRLILILGILVALIECIDLAIILYQRLFQ